MLSVLPAALEETPWAAFSPCLRKRPLPPSCLGEYRSAASRTKRLRQELLRLREWEQRAFQETTRSYEGQADSCDETFTVEAPCFLEKPPQSTYVEDVLESTSTSKPGISGAPGFRQPLAFEEAPSGHVKNLHSKPSHVHGASPEARPLPGSTKPWVAAETCYSSRKAVQMMTAFADGSRGVILSSPVDLLVSVTATPQATQAPNLTLLTPTTYSLTLQRAASNPTNLQSSAQLVPVHISRTSSLPVGFSSSRMSEPPRAGPCSGPLPVIAEVAAAEGIQSDGWSIKSFNCSGPDNPPQNFPPVGASDGVSVQMPKPHNSDVLTGFVTKPSSISFVAEPPSAALGVSCTSFKRGGEVAYEENLPRGETSQGSTCVEANSCESDCGCLASRSSSLVLPPLPQQFLGMPMTLRLKLLEFFFQASEVLGLGIQWLYLASALLDCCWVEWRHKALSGARSAAAGSGLEGTALQQTGLACLLHAYLSSVGASSALPPIRLVRQFCTLLGAGSKSFLRLGEMMPVRADALVKRVADFKALLPLAVAKGSLSSSAWVFGSMLELRGCCTQKEHLVVFVSELCAVGYHGLPQSVISAANCCLLTGAVCCGRAGIEGVKAAGGFVHHHLDHFQVLQDYLCAPLESVSGGGVDPAAYSNLRDLDLGATGTEPSAEISV